MNLLGGDALSRRTSKICFCPHWFQMYKDEILLQTCIMLLLLDKQLVSRIIKLREGRRAKALIIILKNTIMPHASAHITWYKNPC